MQDHNGVQIPFMNEHNAFEDVRIHVADLRRGAQMKSKNRVSQTCLCDIGCHIIVETVGSALPSVVESTGAHCFGSVFIARRELAMLKYCHITTPKKQCDDTPFCSPCCACT